MPPTEKSVPRRTRGDYRYFLTYRTRWSDNDQYSHVNNAMYYHLIDSIVNTYLVDRCGCSPSSYSSLSDSPPMGLVVSSRCEFFSPISFPEVVTLGLRITKLGRSSVTYEVGFFSDSGESDAGRGEGEAAPARDIAKAVGGYTHVFVDRVHRRPVKEMNKTLRKGLEAISVESSTKPKL